MTQNLIKYKFFRIKIRVLYVCWYLKCLLNYRILVEVIEESGINVRKNVIDLIFNINIKHDKKRTNCNKSKMSFLKLILF